MYVAALAGRTRATSSAEASMDIPYPYTSSIKPLFASVLFFRPVMRITSKGDKVSRVIVMGKRTPESFSRRSQSVMRNALFLLTASGEMKRTLPLQHIKKVLCSGDDKLIIVAAPTPNGTGSSNSGGGGDAGAGAEEDLLLQFQRVSKPAEATMDLFLDLLERHVAMAREDGVDPETFIVHCDPRDTASLRRVADQARARRASIRLPTAPVPLRSVPPQVLAPPSEVSEATPHTSHFASGQVASDRGSDVVTLSNQASASFSATDRTPHEHEVLPPPPPPVTPFEAATTPQGHRQAAAPRDLPLPDAVRQATALATMVFRICMRRHQDALLEDERAYQRAMTDVFFGRPGHGQAHTTAAPRRTANMMAQSTAHRLGLTKQYSRETLAMI